MHKSKCIVIFLVLSLNAFAQDTTKNNHLISRFRPGLFWFYTGLKPANIGKVPKYDRLIFDVFYNDWNGDLPAFKNHSNSIGMNTNLMFDARLMGSKNFSFGWGIAYRFFNIRHNFKFSSDDILMNTTSLPMMNNDEKRYLTGHALSLPLEFRFRTYGWKHFKVHLGGTIGYQMRLYSKTIWNGINGRTKLNENAFMDVQKFIYSLHVRFGIRNFGFYAAYHFNPIFRNVNSTQLNVFDLGLSISLF